MLPKFKEDTGVEVKVESFPTEEYATKIQTLMAGGTVGDVMWGISAHHAEVRQEQADPAA